MTNLGKEKTIEQIKKEIANLSPEERAKKLKEAREKQNRNKQSVFADENSFSDLVKKVVVHEDFDYDEQKNDIDLSRVVKFEKDADFSFEQTDLIDLPLLEVVEGDANFEGCNVKTLKNLKKVGKYAWFDDSKIQSLPNLTSVGGLLSVSNTQLTSLPNLTKVGDANFESSNIKELPKLTTIDETASFNDTTIEELPELTTIGVHALFYNSKIKNLPKLESVTFMGFDEGVELPQMPKLKQCEHIKIGSVVFAFEEFRRLESKIRASKNLKEVFNGMAISTDKVYMEEGVEAIITDQFDGVVEWKDSDVGLESSLPWCYYINKLTSLKKVIGGINLRFCEDLKELPNLEKVQGVLVIDYSGITELPKLVEAEIVQCSCGENGIPQMPKLSKCKKIIICLFEKDFKGHYCYPKFEFSFNDFKKYEAEIRKCRTREEFEDIKDKILSKEKER